jgi:prepilin-type N-terminal cleavage/methylation domain-containing protein/prepilin-type processing-associated H-X9-DG protein
LRWPDENSATEIQSAFTLVELLVVIAIIGILALLQKSPASNGIQRCGRHNNSVAGKANVVFCDGHVESPTLPFLFTDTSDATLSRWNRDHQPHRERLAP